MEKFIAVVFDTEAKAYEGAEAMRQLHRDGEIVVYAAGLISKDAEGNVELKSSADEGPIGTAFGLTLGAMVGVLAGPVAVASGAAIAGTAAAAQIAAGGMALGGMTGGLFGAYRDLWVSGVDATMLDNVSTELLPGRSCVLASVDEIWTTPLDTKMKQHGGQVFRKLRVDAVDDQIASEMDALDREMQALDEEWLEAKEEAKAEIAEKKAEVQGKMKATGDKISARLDEMDAEFEARLDAIDAQIENSVDATRAKFEKRKSEIQADWAERKAKLAASLRKQADKLET